MLQGKYYCPDCLVGLANEEADKANERKILADAQAEVDAGNAEWVSPQGLAPGRYVLSAKDGKTFITSWDEYPGDDMWFPNPEGNRMWDSTTDTEIIPTEGMVMDDGSVVPWPDWHYVDELPPPDTMEQTGMEGNPDKWLPAPTTQVSVDVYLGDPEEQLSQWKDIPNVM